MECLNKHAKKKDRFCTIGDMDDPLSVPNSLIFKLLMVGYEFYGFCGEAI